MAEWAVNIISIVFVIIATYISIAVILPLVRGLLNGLVSDDRTVASLMGLLIVIVYVLVFGEIVELLVAIGNKYLNYLDVLNSGLDVLNGLLGYVKWVIVGALVAFGLRTKK